MNKKVSTKIKDMIKSGQLQRHDGVQKMDIHVGSKKDYGDGFQFDCCECGEVVYCRDLSNAGQHIHMECLIDKLQKENPTQE